MDAVARARQRQKDRWRQAGLEAYQNVVRRFVALYDPTKVLTDGDLAQDPNVLRVTDGVALAFDHGRHIIVGDMFRKIMRDANVNGNLDALLGVFTMHLDECIRVPFDSNVPTFRTIAQIAASPEKDFGRVINKKGLDRWENKIRGITCLAHAVVESYNAVCEISSLSQSFLDRNLWAYYASLGLGRMSFVGDSIISSITREDLDPVNVDDALCCWHFFNSQSGVYSIHGFDNIVQWTENQLRIWALIRMDPPQSNYRLLTHAASQMLPDSMIAFVNGFIQRTARMRMAEEIRTNLENRMHLEALRGTGNTVSSIAEDVNDRIPFSQLQKVRCSHSLARETHNPSYSFQLVSTVSLRRFIGPTYNVVAEETLRETCRSLARTIIWQHLLTHAQPITRARIQDDDFRPVSNRNVTFNQLRFPCELWPRFENELVKEVRAMVGRQAASKDEAIEKLRAKGELKPNLELYIKSSRFSLAPKAFGI